MKIRLLKAFVFSVLIGHGLLEAQLTQTENYIYTKTYQSAASDSISYPVLETVTYYDGLGRPKQNVLVKGSNSTKDLVTPITYDGFGRQTLDIFPVPANTTNKGYHGITDQNPVNDYYINELKVGGNAYSEKILENSPLDRIQQQFGPGADWRTHSKKTEFFYEANTDADAVKKYVATFDYSSFNSLISQPSNYPANTLYKNRVKDEDGNETIEFKNGAGQTLLIRKKENGNSIDTYYVYNNYDQLAYVIPPLAVQKNNLNSTTLNNLCYQYKYDGRGRLVEKKLPGKGWEFMIYDKQDRLIMTQDEIMRPNGRWLFTKYDQFGRAAYTGITASSTQSREQRQADANLVGLNNVTRTSSMFISYSGQDLCYNVVGTYPAYDDISAMVSIQYYDIYPPGTPFPYEQKVFGQNILTENNTTGRSVKSLPVASFVKNIHPNDNRWTKNYTFYDTKGRPIGTHSINHLGGETIVHSRIDLLGKVQKTNTYNRRKSNERHVQVQEEFVYDDLGRITKHYHQVLGKTAKELLADNIYNDIGQLQNKKVGGLANSSNPIQNIRYDYNIRGWMIGINLNNKNLDPSKLFSYKINYTNPIGSGVTPKYNGNIAQIDWTFGSAMGNRYNYTYDGLNRLKLASFKSLNGSASADTGYFNESMDYDANGNIKNLHRFGKNGSTAIKIDQLTYNYLSGDNRLTGITDATGNASGYHAASTNPITYDVNGNMLAFPAKGITQNIIYNYLNLPEQIVQDTNPIQYIYRADGVKVGKTFFFKETLFETDYLDGFVYTTEYTQGIDDKLREDDPNTIKLTSASQEEAIVLAEKVIIGSENPPQILEAHPSFFPTAEGFYDYEKKEYIYQYRDHLGNVRLSYARNSSGVIVEKDKNDYYPFGLNFINSGLARYSPSTTYTNYKYQGQELQETGFYSFKWRNYMPDVARFFNIDPLAEKYAYNSTYAFQENKMGLGRELEGLELRQDRGMIIATGMSQNDIYTKEPLPSYMAYYNLNAKAPESQGMDAADLPLGAAGMGRWNDADGSFSSFAGEAKATKALGIFEVIKLANTAIDGIEGMKISAENVKAVNYMGKLVDQFKDMTTAQNVVNKADLKLDSKTKTEITNYVFNGALPADIDKRSNSVVNLGSKTNIVNTANSIMRKNDIVVRNSWETKTKQQNEEAARQQQNKLQNIGR